MALKWFQLGSGSSTNPNNYTEYTGDVELLCPDNEQICAIQAEPNLSNKPIFTTALLAEMVDALHDQQPSDNVKLKLRP